MIAAASSLDKRHLRQEVPRNSAKLKGGPLSIQLCAVESTKPGSEKNGLDPNALLRLFGKAETGSQPLSSYIHREDLQESRSMDSSLLWRPVSGAPPVLSGPDSDELRIHALVIDAPTHMKLAQLQKKLDGTFAVLHTRYGHSPRREEWRVIIPFAKPMPWSDWSNSNKHWRSIFGIANTQTRVWGDDWYGLPIVAPEVQEHYQALTLTGVLFDATSLNRCDAQKSSEVDYFDLNDLLGEELVTQEPESSKQLESSSPMLHVVTLPPTTTPEKTTSGVPSHPIGVIKKAAPKEFPSGYNFPVRAVLVTTCDHNALLRAVRDLTLKITGLHEYFRCRDELCALHLQINARGLWAPGFRPWPKLPQKPRDKCAEYEHTIQRDRIVIEAHWLHAKKEFVNVDTKRDKWIPLFDHAKHFDFDLAEQFAQQVWSNNHRAGEVLGLTPYQQCQMFSLRTVRVKEHVDSISKSTRGPDKRSIQSPQAVIRTALARWKERQPNLGNLDRLLTRAQARYFLGETASAAQVARLAGFISGTSPQDAKTVSESLKGLESWLPTGGIAALGGSL